MKRVPSTTLLLLACGTVSLLLTAAICGEAINQEGCVTDADCNKDGADYWTCNQDNGICLCKNDSACDVSETCNENGFCQKRAGCYSNEECETPQFCDITSGECLDPRNSVKHCSLDTHCPFLYRCNGSVCVPGCLDSSDCPLSFGCVNGNCVAGGCAEREDCDFGQACVSNSCQNGLDSKTCRDCSTLLGRASCMDTSHQCLINDIYEENDPLTHPKEYCTPSCDTDEDCPWGFFCSDLFLVHPDWLCNRGDTCFNGTQCVVGSESLQGVCRCQTAAECQQYQLGDVCENGGCLSGRGCGLFPNLQCADVGVTN